MTWPFKKKIEPCLDVWHIGLAGTQIFMQNPELKTTLRTRQPNFPVVEVYPA